MRHSIGTKLLVTKGKILSPPKGTHKKFASSKLAATARVSKGKSSKKSIPGIGKPSRSTMKVNSILPEQPLAFTGDNTGYLPTSIPAVPVLRLPPHHGLHIHQTPPPTESPNTSVNNSSSLDSVSGTDVITSTAADTACSALVNIPSMRATTPKPSSKPGSALGQGLPWSVPLTHPLSSAATPLATAVNNTSVISGPSAPPRQMS